VRTQLPNLAGCAQARERNCPIWQVVHSYEFAPLCFNQTKPYYGLSETTQLHSFLWNLGILTETLWRALASRAKTPLNFKKFANVNFQKNFWQQNETTRKFPVTKKLSGNTLKQCEIATAQSGRLCTATRL
jgi:hypothetical protein